MKYNLWNSAVKGFYNEKNANPVSKECYGEWMTPKINNIAVLGDKYINGDIWTITKEEAETAATDMIDLAFENVAKCGYERNMINYIDWCGANTQACLGQDGVFDRLY